MDGFKQFNEEEGQNKLIMKIKENPFMPIGICGLLIACGIGARQYKNRGKMSTSIYLMQLRVAAQGAVVGALALGVGYNLAKELYFNKDKKE